MIKLLFQALSWFQNQPRPAQLLMTVLLTVTVLACIDAFNGWVIWQVLFYPPRATVADVRFWSALVYAIVLVLGLPVAFLIWHWRDKNVRDQIENARKDVNLKEFLDVQLRAAGVLDEKLPTEAREQMQIAALHQLRGFLRGDYGKSFQRPAFELLMAGHAATINRIGVPAVQDQLKGKSHKDIFAAIRALREKLTLIDQTRMNIISEDAAYIFVPSHSLNNRRFDLLDLHNKVSYEKLNLSYSYFFGASLFGANLPFANLFGANLQSAELSSAILSGANLGNVNFNYAHLLGADLRATTLGNADFSGAVFTFAKFDDDVNLASVDKPIGLDAGGGDKDSQRRDISRAKDIKAGIEQSHGDSTL